VPLLVAHAFFVKKFEFLLTPYFFSLFVKISLKK